MTPVHRRPATTGTTRLRISDVRFASVARRNGGLLGFVSLTLNGSVRLDGITLRRTLGGKLALSFPARTDGQGRKRPFVRPLNDETRLEIERQVLAALGLEDPEP